MSGQRTGDEPPDRDHGGTFTPGQLSGLGVQHGKDRGHLTGGAEQRHTEEPTDPQVGAGKAAVGQRRVAGRVRHLDGLPPAGDDGEELGVLEGFALGAERQRAPRTTLHNRDQGKRAA